MLGALLGHPAAQAPLPFARQMYGMHSTCTWVNSSGRSHLVAQGEGREQEVLVRPSSFSSKTHMSLRSQNGEFKRTVRCLPLRGDMPMLSLTVATPALECGWKEPPGIIWHRRHAASRDLALHSDRAQRHNSQVLASVGCRCPVAALLDTHAYWVSWLTRSPCWGTGARM